jgi:hypothetical protein
MREGGGPQTKMRRSKDVRRKNTILILELEEHKGNFLGGGALKLWKILGGDKVGYRG